jgi:hypothetical protein
MSLRAQGDRRPMPNSPSSMSYRAGVARGRGPLPLNPSSIWPVSPGSTPSPRFGGGSPIPRRAHAKVRKALRWCGYCDAVVPSEKYRGWTCLRCEHFTHPLWAIRAVKLPIAALEWMIARKRLGVVFGLALGGLVGWRRGGA